MIRTVADVEAAVTNGRTWYGMYRRAGPAMSVGIFSDLSYAAGIPVANYYASTPLVSATLDSGIDLGPEPAAGMSKYLYRATVVPTVAVGIAEFEMVDVVLYYPFVDGDGGEQLMTNTVALPRYSGENCRIMVVSQGLGLSVVEADVTYVNCANEQKTVRVNLNLAAPAGQLCSSFATGSVLYPCGPFLPMAAGCRGVKSIVSVNYLSAGAGIQAFCIVRPVASFGMFEATVAPVEVDFLSDRTFKLPILPSGTYLTLLARGTTAATPSLIGAFQTIWG